VSNKSQGDHKSSFRASFPRKRESINEKQIHDWDYPVKLDNDDLIPLETSLTPFSK